MINIEDLSVVHYCHPGCKPFFNICRLPKEEAILLAYEMAAANPDTSAFYRFAKGSQGFDSYYPRRLMQDDYLYNMFISLGGNPKEKHPLSFVLQGSDWLHKWFGNGLVIRVKLNTIPSECISFTLGDSGEVTKKNGVMVQEIQHGKIIMYTKEMLLNAITKYDGNIDDYMNHITDKYKYIEAQLWNDDYCK
jgi:hypothetical protein